MYDSALFIATGVAFYGGAHHLYLGTRNAADHPHVVHAIMFFLLGGFAMATALTGGAQSVESLSRHGKLSVSFGLLLFATLPWFIVLCTTYKQRLLPALLTAGWCALLLLNIASPHSLLYQDVAGLGQQLPSGQTLFSLHTSANPWWHLVELNMLATLIFSLYACMRHYRFDDKQIAIKLASGLLVLLCTVMADTLVHAGIIDSAYLAPMGFLAFLLASGVYYRRAREEQPATQSAQPTTSYRLTVNLNQTPPAPQHSYNVSSSARDSEALEVERPQPAELTHQQSELPFAFYAAEQLRPSPEQTPLAADQRDQAEQAAPQVPDVVPAKTASAIQTGTTRIDNPVVDEISDSLVDIAVQASMIMNRLKRGHADPQELEVLSRKVRTRAIETRRITHRMLRSDPPKDPDEKDRD